MHFVQVGIHFRTSDLSTREKFVFPQDKSELTLLNQLLNKMPHLIENVIVSTCNRTEIYAVVDDEASAYESIILFLAQTFSNSRNTIEQLVEFRLEDQAIRHLLRVTAGLDSMVIGETEILGQMKDAFFIAQEAKTTKKLCNEFFKQAIALGKQAHNKTQISSHPLSISHLAVQLCLDKVPDFHQGQVLVVGAGSIGIRTVNQLLASGVENIILVNRTLEKAQAQVTDKRVQVHSYTKLYEQLSRADVAFFAIQKDDYVLTKEWAEKLQKARGNQRLWLVDLAVPRNIDPAIKTIKGTVIYDMDNLQGEIERNETQRSIASKKIERLLQSRLEEIKEWRKTIYIHPILQALQVKGKAIQTEVFASMVRKIPNLSEAEIKVIEKHTTSIVNQLMREPIKQLKEKSTQENNDMFLQHFTQIFGIDNLPASEWNERNLNEKQEDFMNKEVGGM